MAWLRSMWTSRRTWTWSAKSSAPACAQPVEGPHVLREVHFAPLQPLDGADADVDAAVRQFVDDREVPAAQAFGVGQHTLHPRPELRRARLGEPQEADRLGVV